MLNNCKIKCQKGSPGEKSRRKKMSLARRRRMTQEEPGQSPAGIEGRFLDKGTRRRKKYEESGEKVLLFVQIICKAERSMPHSREYLNTCFFPHKTYFANVLFYSIVKQKWHICDTVPLSYSVLLTSFL